MTLRGWPPLICWVLGMRCMTDPCYAGVWGTEPVLGILGNYATDPALLNLVHSAETHAALLLDAPTAYNADAFSLTVLPSFRIGDSRGYASTASNYAHLAAKGEWASERGSLSVSSAIARDSSLAHDYVFNGSAGVRRQSAMADIDWNQQWTEKFSLNTDFNVSRVRYAQALGAPSLTDYSNSSFSPTISWAESESNKLTASSSVGLYKSLDGTTRSTNSNVQLGFVRHLNELWTVTTSAGYSRANDKINTFREVLAIVNNRPVIRVVPTTLKSTQNGSVFSVALTHQGDRLSVRAVASRQLVPSGFAFLSRQQTYTLGASYPLSQRWTVNGDARYTQSSDPSLQGIYTDRTVRYVGISSIWHWTEKWNIATNASRVMETFQSNQYKPASTEFSIELSRQFDRVKF